MSHQVETAWIGGDVEAWWDRQRNYVQAELMEPIEAWEKAKINWPVYLVPIEYPEGVETPFNLLVRERELVDEDGKPYFEENALATVGSSYNPLQNWELMEILMAVTQAGHDLLIESAMSLKEGRCVAICARRPEPVEIAGGKHLQYITGANWHGQGRRAVLYGSNVRTECANTLAFGLASAPNVYRFTHTGDMQAKIEEAKKILQMTFDYQDRMVEIGNRSALIPMSEREFDTFLKKSHPITDETAQAEATRMINTREGIRQVYRDSDNLQNLSESPWRALQATVEYYDHKINYQSPDNRFIAALTQDNRVGTAFNVLDKMFALQTK